MGVAYRLTPHISSFIIEQKQNDPKATCQGLSGLVFARFGQQVSKSSVHELLKQAHVITPRKRKITDKFQIPLEKKVEILKALSPSNVLIGGPGTNELDSRLKHSGMTDVVQAAPAADFRHVEILPGKGEVFLKAALWDLSCRPVLGINKFEDIETLNNHKLKVEWEYLTQLVYAIKIELEDNSFFYIDPRFQGLHAQNPTQEFLATSIERAACETADYILNSMSPLIIRGEDTTNLNTIGYDFLSAFCSLQGKVIKKASLLGVKERYVLAEFSLPAANKRPFILGVSAQAPELKISLGGVRIFKTEEKTIITNIESQDEQAIIKQYVDRHPPEGYHLSSILPDNLKEDQTAQGAWLKNRLKQRARMFFPTGFPLEALEEVLALGGYEKNNTLCLQLPSGFKYIQEVQIAAQNINSLHILDTQAKKLRIFIDLSRQEKGLS